MNRHSLKRALCAALSSTLILLSPGLASYQAVAAELTEPVAIRPVGLEGSAKVAVTPTFLEIGTVKPLTGLEVSVEIPIIPGAAHDQTFAQAAASAKPTSAPKVAASTRSAAKTVQALSASIHEKLNRTGELSRAGGADAADFGRQVSADLTGEKLFTTGGSFAPAESVIREPGMASGSHGFLARPAGEDISRSAQALLGGPRSPAPPSGGNNSGGNNGNSDDSGPRNGGQKVPFAARAVSAALALLPAALLGVPMLLGGSILTGSLVVLASLGVASFPFMNAGTSKTLRAIPGVLIGGLGLATLAAGLPAMAGGTLAIGALASLGGWGLVRFARDDGKWKYQSTGDLIGTFFGSFAAVGGAALALAHPAGWLAVGLGWLAYPFTLPLLQYLPGWIGEAISSALRGARLTVADNVHVFGAVHRDTALLKRLSAFSEAAVTKSSWNAVWLGLVVWLPIVAVETVTFLTGALWSVAVAAARLLPLTLWGASYGLKPESKATRFFAVWTETMFRVSKVGVFNRFESRLTPWANSESKLKSLPAALGIRILQLLWIPASALLTTATFLVLGPILALRSLTRPDPGGTRYPSNLRLEPDPLPQKIPEVKEPVVKTSWPGKLIATAIALIPTYFIGLPLILGGHGPITMLLGSLLSASIALMPLMPSQGLPKALRALPADSLKFAGLMTVIGALRYSLVGLPTGPLLALGVLAALSGVGLSALIAKLQDEKTKSWKLEEPQYIGGFVAALGVSSALGMAYLAALGAVTGPLATAVVVGGALTSPLLLYHLPKALWQGVGFALQSLGGRMQAVYHPLDEWGHKQVGRSLSQWYRYWTNESDGKNPTASRWNAVFFMVPWGLQKLVQGADYILAFALGLTFGLARFPANVAWGAAYNGKDGKVWGPNGKGTRFLSGFAQAWQSYAEGKGAQTFFVKHVIDPLVPALGDKVETSNRPTAEALGALLLAQLATLVWLVWAALGVALGWLPALFAGIKNALGAKTPPKNPWEDPDKPAAYRDTYAPVAQVGTITAKNMPGNYRLEDADKDSQGRFVLLDVNADGTFAAHGGFQGTIDPASALSGRWTVQGDKFVGISKTPTGEQRTEIYFQNSLRQSFGYPGGSLVMVKTFQQGAETSRQFRMMDEKDRG